jgi:hypothetical protein
LGLQFFLTAVTALIALVALMRARRVSRRLERLSESYWELRYEYGQLSARLSRLEGPGDPASPVAPASASGGDARATFVPLSSLKR